MRPDEKYNLKLAAQETLKLSKIQARLTKEEKLEIQQDARDLAVLQDQKEDISCLPSLSLNDIERKVNSHETHSAIHSGVSIHTRITATNGISYFSIFKNISSLPTHLKPYLPIFTNVTTGTTYEITF